MFPSSKVDLGFKRSQFPESFFDLVPQAAIRQAICVDPIKYNSIWDLNVSPEGRVYFANCAELTVSEAGKFIEYLPETNSFKEWFDLKKVCLWDERTMPPSKIHSSISFMEDGRVIMTTHTTAASKGHPAWIMDGHYNHQWEGYVGSNLLIFDPKTGGVENLGIPVYRDTIYGGVYDPKGKAFYFLTMFRGHAYRFDLKTHETKDLGQATEFGTFRLCLAKDGNIYGSSRSGRLFRINTEKEILEDTGIDFPCDDNKFSRAQRLMCFGANGPDDRIYIAGCFMNQIYAYDTQKNQLENMGPFVAAPHFDWPFFRQAQGLCFDASGVLWYAAVTPTETETMIAHLHSWDLLNGGAPKNWGVIGTKHRAAGLISEMHHHNGKLYAADSNHAEDFPAICEIDLQKLRASENSPAEILEDPKMYYLLSDGKSVFPGTDYEKKIKPYQEGIQSISETFRIAGENRSFAKAEKLQVVRLWHRLPIDESAVISISSAGKGIWKAICGKKERYEVTLSREALLDLKKIPTPSTLKSEAAAGEAVPCRKGRQYLGRITAESPWTQGRQLVGTADGLVALYHASTKKYFNLGAIVNQGAIHQIVVNESKTLAYGVAGDRSDLGMIFRYDDQEGLREMGRIFDFNYEGGGAMSSSEPSCLALSEAENILAVGVRDRLGCVYFYENIF